MRSRGMNPSWTACWVTEKAPEMTAWLAMIVASVAMTSSGIVSDGGTMWKNGLSTYCGCWMQHRRLAHVVEHERRHDEVQPRVSDRLAAEMAHVGVERLGAGHGVDHRAQRQERIERVGDEEAPDVSRAERSHDLRMTEDMVDAHRGDRREIDQHHRAEHVADAVGAVALDREQADQDRERDPDDVGLEVRR